MSLSARRREVAIAEQHLRHERARWRTKTLTLRRRLARHRIGFVVGLGAAAGFVCGLVPLRPVFRIGRFIASVAAFALRTPIGAMLIDDMKHRATASRATLPRGEQ